MVSRLSARALPATQRGSAQVPAHQAESHTSRQRPSDSNKFCTAPNAGVSSGGQRAECRPHHARRTAGERTGTARGYQGGEGGLWGGGAQTLDECCVPVGVCHVPDGDVQVVGRVEALVGALRGDVGASVRAADREAVAVRALMDRMEVCGGAVAVVMKREGGRGALAHVR